jgi:hypothetical protein
MRNLQTSNYIADQLAEGKQILTIEELIESLPFEVENPDNLWYGSVSHFFIGKDANKTLTIISTPARNVTGFKKYPGIGELPTPNQRLWCRLPASLIVAYLDMISLT